MLQEMEALNPAGMDEMEEVFSKELFVFQEGEKYDYLKDIKDAYSDSLAKSRAEKIFETIPDHHFWDIKTPLTRKLHHINNPYNPFRPYPFSSFFELRDYEEYIDRKEKGENIKTGISLYRRY